MLDRQIVFFAYGFYFVFPSAIFQALSYFNWMVRELWLVKIGYGSYLNLI